MLASNAKLTRVSTASIEKYGGSSTAPKWEGNIDCYLEQKTGRSNNGQGSELTRKWNVYVPTTLAIDWTVDDVLTILFPRRGRGEDAIYEVPIQAIDIRDDPSMPPEVCTVALAVEPAAP